MSGDREALECRYAAYPAAHAASAVVLVIILQMHFITVVH